MSKGNIADESDFKASGYHWRLFCGSNVLEQHLQSAVRREGAQRALVVCSPSVRSKTDIIARIAAALGDAYAGVFDGIEKDSTYASVRDATTQARAVEADLLIAVGGGSVLVATRAVAIFLCEAADPFELMTQYPEGGRPFSPRLLAPKLPIFNVPTTPTSAMNRAGTGLKNPALDHRMEYFDPKTRPHAIFIDDGALMSVPDTLLRSTATTVFSSLVSAQAHLPGNPLVAADQQQAFTLGHDAYVRLADAADNAQVRRDLCLTAFLQNRAEDDGRPLMRSGPFAGDYAVSTALHIRYPEIGQGESTSVIHAPALRIAGEVDALMARRVASGLGVWEPGMESSSACDAIAATFDELYARNGMPPNLRSLEVPREDFPELASLTLNNFNARASRGSAESRESRTLQLLEAAW